MQTQAIILTHQAPEYLDALCTHFAEDHAFALRHTPPSTGHILLPGNGSCLLHARADRLILELQAPEDNAAALAEFLSRHIRRLPRGRELHVEWHAAKGETV